MNDACTSDAHGGTCLGTISWRFKIDILLCLITWQSTSLQISLDLVPVRGFKTATKYQNHLGKQMYIPFSICVIKCGDTASTKAAGQLKYLRTHTWGQM